MANPILLTMPLCVNADKNTIPTTDAGTSGLFSEEKGFQTINSLPLTAGGKAPARQDFNGIFALLGGIDFMTQRGYIFEFDENLDYVTSCVVRDTDGGIYFCKNDVSASSTHPKDDTTNWQLINYGINKKETFTTSGSFTAPYTGTYRITLQGGGGGGAGGRTVTYNLGGGGGGGGAKVVAYEKLTAGASYPFIIGAGGIAGLKNGVGGGAGGNTTITIGSNVYVAGGGSPGSSQTSAFGDPGYGGVGTINSVEVSRGFSGCAGGDDQTNNILFGGTGGGAGGSRARNNTSGDTPSGYFGGGGAGGSCILSTPLNGGTGGDGYITFEYCDI